MSEYRANVPNPGRVGGPQGKTILRERPSFRKRLLLLSSSPFATMSWRDGWTEPFYCDITMSPYNEYLAKRVEKVRTKCTNHERSTSGSLAGASWMGGELETASDGANKVCIPLVRSNTFVNEENRVRIVLRLDRSELVVMRPEERLLPIKLVW